MIYLLAIALILTAFGFARKARQRGFLSVMLDFGVAAVSGFLAGVFIGLGARIAMSAIAFANGDSPGFTLSGSIQVIITFASFGIILGLIYEALFRDLLRHSGLAFGLLLTLCLWYPLADSGVQVLRFQPTAISLIFISGVLIALMWLPFAFALEELLRRWHSRVNKYNQLM
jgi:hypothetical protein